jgi:hypothetical protein
MWCFCAQLETKPIIAKGYAAMIHIHCCVEEGARSFVRSTMFYFVEHF